MAELNDKLITYGNLSTFYDKLQEQGLGGNAIEEVSELPNASENKDKLFRLDNGEKDVYAAKLLSSETITTNKLPDEQQIDKAFLIDANPEVYKYEGDWTIVCTDGNVTLKCWNCDIEDDKAFFTVDNAETITSSSKIISVPLLDWTDVDLENKSLNADKTKSEVLELIENGNTLPTYELIPIPAIYNAPESAQIGNATIVDEYAGDTYYYNGTSVTLVDYDGTTVEGYAWWYDNTDLIVSTHKASEIFYYHDNDNVYLGDTIFYNLTSSARQEYWNYDASTNTYTNSDDSPTLSYYNMNTGEGFNKIDALYIPQLNAPDSEQVGVAYIDMQSRFHGSHRYYYRGEIQIRTYNGETTSEDYIIGHLWNTSPETTEWDYCYITLTNAEDVNTDRIGGAFPDEDLQNYNNGLGWVTPTMDLNWVAGHINYYDDTEIISQTSNVAKYQRTETTEVWDWQPLTDNATNDDIDLMFASEIKLIRAQEDDENYIDWLVNTSGETMEFNGQTYYKWVVWGNDFNDGSGPAVEHPNVLVLTNTLNVQLPFNSNSPEFECRISIDGEEMTSQDYIHGDYTQKTVQ